MKGERQPKSAISCLKKAKAVRTSSEQRGRGKGKPVSTDHWHFLLSWPLSPGSTQRKGCQVSVTGPRASSFVFREHCGIGDPGEMYTGTWAEK